MGLRSKICLSKNSHGCVLCFLGRSARRIGSISYLKCSDRKNKVLPKYLGKGFFSVRIGPDRRQALRSGFVQGREKGFFLGLITQNSPEFLGRRQRLEDAARRRGVFRRRGWRRRCVSAFTHGVYCSQNEREYNRKEHFLVFGNGL